MPPIELEVFQQLCWDVGTPFAYKAYLMSCRADWLGITGLTLDPQAYTCPHTYHGDAQIAAFFKKFPGFDLGLDLKKAAEASFWEAERQCYQTNERLNPLLDDSRHYGDRIHELIRVWRKEVKTVLGRAPEPSRLRGKFGPGSTFSNLGDEITLLHKLSENYTRTNSSAPFLQWWDESAWSRYAACDLYVDTLGDVFVAHQQGKRLSSDDGAYAVRDFSVVRGNRFTTVPKDSRKLRGICIEPSLNVFAQLGVGSYLTSRMEKMLGWKKDLAGDYHKILARIGSLTGSVATIDLSSASDTVCSNLVKLLLPPAWWSLVDSLRSRYTNLNGRWVKLEKFSSMGNGFTFELETLIFWTLARALQALEPASECPFTPGLTTSVFGDDIIVPSSTAASLIAALNFFGFQTNKSKTFLTGPFRESCGGDYMSGFDVRPHFQKEECSEPHQLIALANGLRRTWLRRASLRDGDHFRRAWFKCLDRIPAPIRRLRGPEALGDLVICDSEAVWASQPSVRVRNSIRYLRVWRPVPNRVIGFEHWRPGVVLAAALYGASDGTPKTIGLPDVENFRKSGQVPRVNGSYVSGYRFGRVAFS